MKKGRKQPLKAEKQQRLGINVAISLSFSHKFPQIPIL